MLHIPQPILVIGANGYVSNHMKSIIRRGYLLKNVTYVPFRSFYDPNKPMSDCVAKIYNSYDISKYKFVINCVGYTGENNIDDAAKDENIKKLKDLNVELPIHLAEQLPKSDKVFCQMSTGCIYYSYKKNGESWEETDEPTNKDLELFSRYSLSKYLTEKTLLDIRDKIYIWRIRLPIDDDFYNKKNYLYKICNYKKILSMDNSYTHMQSFINSLGYFLDVKQEYYSDGGCMEYGVYNMTNLGYTNAKNIFNIIMKNSIKLPFSPEFYESYNDFMDNSGVVEHRSNCVLNTSKFQNQVAKIQKYSSTCPDSVQRDIPLFLRYSPSLLYGINYVINRDLKVQFGSSIVSKAHPYEAEFSAKYSNNNLCFEDAINARLDIISEYAKRFNNGLGLFNRLPLPEWQMPTITTESD